MEPLKIIEQQHVIIEAQAQLIKEMAAELLNLQTVAGYECHGIKEKLEVRKMLLQQYDTTL